MFLSIRNINLPWQKYLFFYIENANVNLAGNVSDWVVYMPSSFSKM